MSLDQPPHGLFFKWGKLQVGAYGIPAIVTVWVVLASAIGGRWFGLW